MTYDKINSAIAEYCGCDWYAVEKGGRYYRQGGHGYTNRIEEAGKYSKKDAQKEIIRGEPMSVVKILHPNYCNDLNAMHEVEELFYAKADTLEGAERMRDYSKWLCHLTKYPLHATASQRAKAFLQTIGKWEE